MHRLPDGSWACSSSRDYLAKREERPQPISRQRTVEHGGPIFLRIGREQALVP